MTVRETVVPVELEPAVRLAASSYIVEWDASER